MSTPHHRDRSLHRVNRLTVWLAGIAFVAAGTFAAVLGHTQDSGASTSTGTVGADGTGSDDVATPATTPPTTITGSSRSSTPSTVTPPTTTPRSTRRRPSVSSGGS